MYGVAAYNMIIWQWLLSVVFGKMMQRRSINDVLDPDSFPKTPLCFVWNTYHELELKQFFFW